MLFGTGHRATAQTQEFLRDVVARWRDDLKNGRVGRFGGFAPDAQIFVIEVNLRDAPGEAERRFLLQLPAAFSISDTEVTRLIAAGRQVLRASKDFQALQRSLGFPARP